LNEKLIIAVQKGRIKIEKDLTGGGYDLVFQHEFLDSIGFMQSKAYDETLKKNEMSKKANCSVLVIVIGVKDFMEKVWNLSEKTGLTTQEEVLKLIESQEGKLKSVYPIPDYTF
jgi:hypothetical protein